MPSTIGIVASGRSFSPLSLSPALWLDAADTATITSSGSPAKVSQWNDKSGNGRNVSQATSANQPTTGATTLNGLNVITYDGVDDVLLSAANAPDVTAMSSFVVARHSSFATITPRIFELTNAAGSGRNFVVRDDIANEIGQLIISTSTGTATRNTLVDTMTVNTWRYFGFVWAGGGSTAANFTIRVAGADSNGTFTSQAGTPLDTTNHTYRIGNSAAGIRSWTGDFAEMIIWHRALTTAEVADVESYLKSKWGL